MERLTYSSEGGSEAILLAFVGFQLRLPLHQWGGGVPTLAFIGKQQKPQPEDQAKSLPEMPRGRKWDSET